MCLLCDDEKAYQAYMNYLDAMERQGKAADPDKAMDAVLDQLEAPTRRAPRTIPPTTRPCLRSSAARSINDRVDIDDDRRGQEWPREQVFYLARTDRRASGRDRGGARAQCLRAGDAGSGPRHGARGRRQDRQGRGRSARRHSARHQGSVRDQGCAHHRVLENPRQFRAALRIDRDLAALARRRGHARQAQQ